MHTHRYNDLMNTGCIYISAFVYTHNCSLESTLSVVHLAPGAAQRGFRKTNEFLRMNPELREEVKGTGG